MQNIKRLEILKGINLLLLSVLIYLALLFFGCLPEGNFEFLGRTWNVVQKSDSRWLWMSAIIIPILFFEGGLLTIRRGRVISNVDGTYPKSKLWSGFVRFRLSLSLLFSRISILVQVGLALFAVKILLDLSRQTPDTLPEIVENYFLIAGAYCVLRMPLAFIFRKMSKPFGKLARKGLTKYNVVRGGVEIDLGVRMPKSGKPARFKINFSELKEVRSMTYIEAEKFLQYTVGSNLKLSARQTSDLYKYYREEIPRPRVYTLAAPNTVGITVLLRGGDLFYLFCFDTDDASDLINAFESYRKRKN